MLRKTFERVFTHTGCCLNYGHIDVAGIYFYLKCLFFLKVTLEMSYHFFVYFANVHIFYIFSYRFNFFILYINIKYIKKVYQTVDLKQ